MFEFDPSGFGCEAPVGLGMMLVAMFDPGCDLASEHFLVGDAAIKALAGEDRQFRLCQIEPGPMLGRIHPFKSLNEAASLWCAGKAW